MLQNYLPIKRVHEGREGIIYGSILTYFYDWGL